MRKISVIVPIYNVEKYIGRCLESILKQTCQDFEIICVDDCGQDSSMQIVEKFHNENAEKIKIIYGDKNCGLGAARDKGILAAEGEYITFVDSDDYLERTFLETYLRYAEENRSDVVIGGYIRDINGKFSEIPINVSEKYSEWVTVYAWAKLYRTEFLKTHNLSFCGIRRYEDEGFGYRLLLAEPKVKKIGYCGYYYYMNENSITQSVKKDRTGIIEEYFGTVRKTAVGLKGESGKKELLDYCLVSGLVANILYNGQGCGVKRMKEIYRKFDEFLNIFTPDICCNRYVALRYLKSEPKKKRYATWLVVRLRKIKLDKLIFELVSMM